MFESSFFLETYNHNSNIAADTTTHHLSFVSHFILYFMYVTSFYLYRISMKYVEVLLAHITDVENRVRRIKELVQNCSAGNCESQDSKPSQCSFNDMQLPHSAE